MKKNDEKIPGGIFERAKNLKHSRELREEKEKVISLELSPEGWHVMMSWGGRRGRGLTSFFV